MRLSNCAVFFYYWLACKTSRIDKINTLLKRADRMVVEFILRQMKAKIGKNADIESYFTIHGAYKDYSNLVIGDNVHIGKDAFFDLIGKIIIEDDVTIAMRSLIITHTDVGRSPLGKELYPKTKKDVILKKDCYVGANVTILMGVNIGEGSVIGAGSVVTRDIPPNSVAVGSPAKVIKTL
ncbi:MAG: acyltransferase [Candidatus Omnitrophota bacterium]|nr:acyltransferase [Candidatus Omnitrophota bacterium]